MPHALCRRLHLVRRSPSRRSSSAILLAAGLLTASLTTTTQAAEPTLTERYPTRAAAVNSLEAEVTTGTLLFSQGDCLAVRCFTKSLYTHVGMVVVTDGKPMVYDSCKGSGVRCTPLADYLEFLNRDVVHLFQPAERFNRTDRKLLVSYLKDQIGTPYSVKHHLTGKRADGVHCAEYMTDALMTIDLIHANRPPKVSPATLAEGLIDADLYDAVKTIEVESPPAPKGNGWCDQLWIDTKECTKSSCRKLKGWFLCG